MPSRCKPAANGFDLFRRRLLFGEKVVESEHHQSVGVGQDPFIDRQSITRLIDALEHGDGMAGDVLPVIFWKPRDDR